VHDAVRRSDGLRVAIKRSKPMDARQGLNFTALREVNYLQGLKCKAVVALLDVFLTGDSLHLVLEFCPFDLQNVVYDKKLFLTEAHIKSYMQQLLQGVAVCHEHHVRALPLPLSLLHFISLEYHPNMPSNPLSLYHPYHPYHRCCTET